MWLFLDYGFVNEYENFVDYHIFLLQDIIVNQELKHGFLLMNDIKLCTFTNWLLSNNFEAYFKIHVLISKGSTCTCNLLSPMEYVLNTVMILDKEDFKRCYI